MSDKHFVHGVGHAFHKMDELSPVRSDKSAILAFVLGFLFGPFGVGLYLQSWGDFFITLAMVVFGAFFTVGIGAPVFWVLCGAWAAVRVAKAK